MVYRKAGQTSRLYFTIGCHGPEPHGLAAKAESQIQESLVLRPDDSFRFPSRARAEKIDSVSGGH